MCGTAIDSFPADVPEGAVWSGPMADALEACPPLSWESLSLSDAAVIHVLQCRPGSDGTWNHGLFALAARDGARTLFLYENW